MLLTEIKSINAITQIAAGDYDDFDVNSVIASFQNKRRAFKRIALLGNGYTLNITGPRSEFSGNNYVIKYQNSIVGYIITENESINGIKVPMISEVGLDRKHRGKGLMVMSYLKLIKLKGALLSDSMQTPKGSGIWKKLFEFDSIKMYGVNPHGPPQYEKYGYTVVRITQLSRRYHQILAVVSPAIEKKLLAFTK